MPITRSTFATPFSYRLGIFAILASLALGCSAALGQTAEQKALGAFYYGAREYNLITFGNYIANGQDTWGAVAVGGNFTANKGMTLVNFEWACPTNSIRSRASDPSVIVAGKIKLQDASVTNMNYGKFTYDPVDNGHSYFTENGTRFHPADASKETYINLKTGVSLADWSTASSVVNFGALKEQLTSANKTLGACQSTSGIMSSDRTSIATQGTGVSYLSINANDFSNNDLKLSVAKDSFLVINVHVSKSAGDTLWLKNVKLAELNGADPQQNKALLNSSANRILWNVIFDDTTYNTLKVDTNDIYGSFLSLGTIKANGRIWGQVITDAYNQSTNIEIHQALMEVNLTMIPEPSTIALGMGTLALGFVFWRRYQRKTNQA